MNCGWMVILGILLIILGLIALGSAVTTSFVLVALLGWILLIAGIADLIRMFTREAGESIWGHLVGGILRIIVGLILILSPGIGLATITLIVGLYFLINGAFRLIVSLTRHPPGWGWSFAYGLITLILGLILLTGFPISGAVFIGIFVGIELIVAGLAVIFTGSAPA